MTRFPSIPRTLAVLTLLTLGGCTHYRYIQPESEQGKHCVEKLDADVYQCEKRAEETRRSDREFYDFQMIGYRACTNHTASSAQMPTPCGPEPVDPSTAQRQACKKDYKASFIGCGGRLEKIEDN